MNEGEKNPEELLVKSLRKRMTMKDNRPKWVIYFDVAVWIVTIVLIGYFLFQYNLNYYVVNIYLPTPEQDILAYQGKVMNLNVTDYLQQNNMTLINITNKNGELR